MARSIRRCLGTVVMLGPLVAMLAMIAYGVPSVFPTPDLPKWLGGDVTITPRATPIPQEAGKRPSDVEVSDRRSRLARPLPATSRRSRHVQAMTSPRSTRATWKQVRIALAAHGIEQFQIQPADRVGEVHFSCMQPVPNRLRVMRRFEAEAADPVQAARDVLLQIEQFDRGLSQVVRAR